LVRRNDSIPSPRRNIVSAIEQIASFYTAGFRITKTINMIVWGICWQEYRLAATAAIIYQYRASRIQSRNKTPREATTGWHSILLCLGIHLEMKSSPIKASVLYCFSVTSVRDPDWYWKTFRDNSGINLNSLDFQIFLNYLSVYIVYYY